MRFGEKASSYDLWATPQKRSAVWLAEWVDDDCSDLHAVEYGAGTGLFTSHLCHRNFKRLVVIEKSRRMALQGLQQFPNCDWRVEDAWEGVGESFDRAYSCSLLQWAENPQAVLKNWRRGLKSGGKLLCGIYVADTLTAFQKVDTGFSAVEWRTQEEWSALVGEAGFRVLRSETRLDEDKYPSALDALRSIHKVGAVGDRRRSAVALRRFLKACDARSRGGFNVEWRTLRIEAEAV